MIREYASEEQDSAIHINSLGKYSISVDPLDGSSVLEANLTVGTIIGIYKGSLSENNLVVAMYLLYGPTTILVVSTGNNKVSEFILNGDHFELHEENIQLREQGQIFSTGGLRRECSENHKNYLNFLENAGYKLRYSGCLVADAHHILKKKGGIFTYPLINNEGKLRLLFELKPLSFIFNHAGGQGICNNGEILNLVPGSLHQKDSFYLGSKIEIEKAKSFLGI